MNLRESLNVIDFGPVATVGPGDDERVEGFKLEEQERDNWCWAAVAVSVARHHNSPNVLTQCKVVEHTGCGDCLAAACDRPGDVIEALGQQNLTAVTGPSPAPDLDAILDALHHERPVICSVRQEPAETDSLPHVVVIVRARRSNRTVKVKDPGKDRFFEKRWDIDRFSGLCVAHMLLQ